MSQVYDTFDGRYHEVPEGWPFAVGDRVRLVRDVERYPFFCAREGLSGVVVGADAEFLRVRMDEHIPEAADWDNCLIWMAQDERDEAIGDLVKVEVRAMLYTEHNTRATRLRIVRAFHAMHGAARIHSTFEHGQWWITRPRDGAQWSVVDASGPGSHDGFDFEQMTEGRDPFNA